MHKNDLIQIIHQWDRKNNSILESFFQLHQHQENCLSFYLDFDLSDEKFQDAITWFIKKYLENGYTLSNDETEQFINLAKKVKSWGSNLTHFTIIFLCSLPEGPHNRIIHPFYEIY